VNVTIKTLDMGRVEAMGILSAYMAAITAIAVALDYKDLSIKL
jgi:phosphatidylinositol glycan class W